MALWKKSEDPWDRRSETPKKADGTPTPWYPAEKPKETELCPWCGQPMLAGTLYGSRRVEVLNGMCWREGTGKGFLDTLLEKDVPRTLALRGCEEAWYCEACHKLVLDTAPLHDGRKFEEELRKRYEKLQNKPEGER